MSAYRETKWRAPSLIIMMIIIVMTTSGTTDSRKPIHDDESSGDGPIFADDEDLFAFPDDSRVDDELLWIMEGKHPATPQPNMDKGFSFSANPGYTVRKASRFNKLGSDDKGKLIKEARIDQHRNKILKHKKQAGMKEKKKKPAHKTRNRSGVEQVTQENKLNFYHTNDDSSHNIHHALHRTTPSHHDTISTMFQINETVQTVTNHQQPHNRTQNTDAFLSRTRASHNSPHRRRGEDQQSSLVQSTQPDTTASRATSQPAVEMSCESECRRVLDSIQLNVQPSRQLVMYGSDVQLSCHVTTGRQVTAVVGWKFESAETKQICSRPPSERVVVTARLWGLQAVPARCGTSSMANERVSVNQTMVVSQLSLPAVELKSSGQYTCEVRATCCQQSPAGVQYRRDSVATYIHVYSHGSTYGRLAVIVAVCTCTLAGLLAAVALMKGCVRRKISRRLSGLSYEAVHVYSQDPIFTAGSPLRPSTTTTAAADNNDAATVGFSEQNSLKSVRSARAGPVTTFTLGQRSCANIYPNPLDAQYDVPLTPPDSQPAVGR